MKNLRGSLKGIDTKITRGKDRILKIKGTIFLSVTPFDKPYYEIKPHKNKKGAEPGK